MVAIVCQSCNQVIDYQESDKIGTLYGVCSETCHPLTSESEIES